MTLFDITLQGIRKQKIKKVFLVLAIAASLLTILMLVSYTNSQKTEIEDQFDQYGANIVITPKTDSLSLSYGGVNLNGIVTRIEEIRISQLELLKTIPNAENIRSVSPKLIGIGDISNKGSNTDILFIGVNFEAEREIKLWWELNGKFPEVPDEIIAGSEAALKLGLKPGDTVTIKDYNFIVSGILNETGSQDDHAVFADLTRTQKVLGREGGVSLVEVSALCRDCPIDDIVHQIEGVMPDAEVKAISQVMTQKMILIDQFSQFIFAVCLVLAVMCALLVFMTISASVSERKKEIGIYRAIGFGKLSIIQIIITETVILAAAGCILAIALSPAALSLIKVLAGSGNMLLDPLLIISSAAGAVGVSILAGFFPALRASAIDPVSAINSL